MILLGEARNPFGSERNFEIFDSPPVDGTILDVDGIVFGFGPIGGDLAEVKGDGADGLASKLSFDAGNIVGGFLEIDINVGRRGWRSRRSR